MATITVHAGHFVPGKIYLRLDNSLFRSDTMRLKDVTTGSVISYKLQDFTELEVASEESTKKMMGAIGWGLVGDLALGPLGLLAGVLSGGKQTDVKFTAAFNDGRRMLATTDSKTFTTMQAALFNKSLASIPPPLPAPSARTYQVGSTQFERQKLIAADPSKRSSWKGKLSVAAMFIVGFFLVSAVLGGHKQPNPTSTKDLAALARSGGR
jgi:hypothetical protein